MNMAQALKLISFWTMVFILFMSCGISFGMKNLDAVYPFSATLVDGSYNLYWNFSWEDESLQFAVSVKTTGWIGFGLSPSGQMEGSDVVIGWVGDDETYFHDRFAFRQELPPIDPIQNWYLTYSEVEDGYTILEYKRDFITCDDRDREIHADTSRVVFSWNDNRPTVTTDSDGSESYSIARHQTRGSTSINLLGGLPSSPEIPNDAETFTIAVNEVEIPAVHTEYYCKGIQLDEKIRNEEKYIIKISPAISESSAAYVHHILVYVCDGLSDDDLGEGGSCDSEVSYRMKNCLSSLLIAAWAVGGSEFLYPENVAYPIGGPDDNNQFVVIQIHYNNPYLDEGIIDSSGLQFTYIDTPREHNAGILFTGHDVVSTMVIPPGAANFTITSICSDTCTNEYFPSDGIHIFASMLHTHLIGIGLEFSVVDDTKCPSGESRYEQTKLIDRNQNYDFNFQQATHLPQEIIVKPGSTLLSNCYYDSSHRSDATLGGESTTQEMCLTFPVYYPRVELSHCTSRPSLYGFTQFILNFVPEELREHFTQLTPNTPPDVFIATLGLLEWNEEQLKGFYDSFYANNLQTATCRGGNGRDFSQSYLPHLCCAYETKDPCTGRVPADCCDRTCLSDNVNRGQSVKNEASMITVGLLTLLVVLYLLKPQN